MKWRSGKSMQEMQVLWTVLFTLTSWLMPAELLVVPHVHFDNAFSIFGAFIFQCLFLEIFSSDVLTRVTVFRFLSVKHQSVRQTRYKDGRWQGKSHAESRKFLTKRFHAIIAPMIAKTKWNRSENDHFVPSSDSDKWVVALLRAYLTRSSFTLLAPVIPAVEHLKLSVPAHESCEFRDENECVWISVKAQAILLHFTLTSFCWTDSILLASRTIRQCKTPSLQSVVCFWHTERT